MRIDEIISMARETGLQASIEICGSVYRAVVPSNLERFAALVASREREALLHLVDSYAKNNVDLRCSSLCSPDETFCAITKDGKCDAMDRSCDAALAATEPKP